MAIASGQGDEKKHAAAKPLVDMNIVPLIDILLVLLIIFMAISPLKPHKLESKIPEKPPENSNIVNPLALVVSISADATGRLTGLKLNVEAVTEETLGETLREIVESRPADQRSVFISAPRVTLYGDVVRVIDIVKNAGATPIGLQIDDLPEH
jgi:biopolymer transport protein ExbD